MRSQMAQGFYNHMTQSNQASSAATSPHTEGIYIRPADEAITVMQEEGIDISHQTVQHLTKQDVDEADEIYVLNSRGDCPLFLSESPKAVFWNVRDPYGSSIETFRNTRDLIKEKVKQIL